MNQEILHAPSLRDSWGSLRFLQLIVFLLAVLMLQALVRNPIVTTFSNDLLYLNALLVALSAANARRNFRYSLVLLWLVMFLARFHPASELHVGLLALRLLGALLAGFCVFSILRFVASSRQATIDPLFAAAAGYLLIAMLFAQLYTIVEQLLPASFSIPVDYLAASPHPAVIFNYFSVITITTVGFGDIVPQHPLAQMLVAIEAVVGQFFIAVAAAWLVSRYATKYTESAR
jgi:voltage-gated potassium channel